MVVLLIIAALAGMLAPALFSARRRADRNLTSQEITRLRLGVENFADLDPYGDWPPATLAPLGVAGSNGVNEGNESLVVCLSTQRGEGPYFEFEFDRLANLDGDAGPEKVLREGFRSPYAGNELKEYVDVWGNPYVYFPAAAYGTKAAYTDGDGVPFEAAVTRDTDTGTYPARLNFVIWSSGPDGRNENGGGDDIVSWH
jgi:type II secretory pathway pseudopilin PulG